MPGSNGVLDLARVQMIVAEFELEGEDDCDDEGVTTCSEFEADAFFIDMPLNGTTLSLAPEIVPNGTYQELEFEVEDLEDDGDDDQAPLQLLNEIRGDYADWPDGASMRIAGTFTPQGGEAQPFVVYFDAEIEIELDFEPPLTLADDSDAELTIVLDPNSWFTRPDGTVIDLSQFDYGTTSELLEFELEVEDGFREIEVEN